MLIKYTTFGLSEKFDFKSVHVFSRRFYINIPLIPLLPSLIYLYSTVIKHLSFLLTELHSVKPKYEYF
jgi:hypothetical protein